MNKTYECSVAGLILPGCGESFVNGKLILDDRGAIDHVLVAMKAVPINEAKIICDGIAINGRKKKPASKKQKTEKVEVTNGKSISD